MRSKAKERELKYGSARKRAAQKAVSERGPYIKLPAGAKLFKPKAGTMLLDIIPFEAGEGNPFAQPGILWYERTYYVHRDVGPNQEMHLCPAKTFQKKCPICEARMAMLRKGEDEDLIKDMEPKQRQLFNVINTKEPDKGVQLMDISFHLFGKVLDSRIDNAEEDEGWHKFFFLKGGKTLRVVFKDESFGGRSFVKAESIDFKDRKEPYDADILDSSNALDELIQETEYKELKKLYLGGGPGKAKDDDDEEEEESDEDDEEDDEEEETPKKKSSKKSEQDEDGEDEESREDEDEEEDDSDESESDDDDESDDNSDEEESEDEEEEEEKPAKKKRKFGDGKSKVKTKDEEDEESEDEEESEEEEEAPKSKKKKSSKDDDEEDGDDDNWDDFYGDDEEEEKPAKKKAKK